ncbi:MAG: 1-acyl-sn-glycerol-3-phosphate acyltransferase [Clostridiales bacterium]|nr:1-acyl-sn-glycerol-3-phosphate acyltransferase [Clostridiales bacterium]
MKTRKPNAFLYFILYILIYPILKIFFRLRVDRSRYRAPEGAFIMLSNHVSFMDFLLAMLCVYPKRVNPVAAQKFFFYKPLDKLLPTMGCIPKNLFDADARAIKGIFGVIRRGGGVLLFPEGRCTVDGAYMGMHTSTGKLIKKLGVPVVSCHIEGSYICMPFWRRGLRFGREHVTLTNLFSAADIAELTPEEINARIDAALQGEGRAPFAGKVYRARQLAEGLENILYICPKCKREFTLETHKNTIRCKACGNTGHMDRTQKLTPTENSVIPETVHAWYAWIMERELAAMHEDMDPITVHVTVRMPAAIPGAGLAHCGQGMLSLDSKGWHFDGELHGEPSQITFPIHTVPAIPFDPKDNFQIYAQGSFYVFTPDNPVACSKYATLGECAYLRFANPVQMTGCAAFRRPPA